MLSWTLSVIGTALRTRTEVLNGLGPEKDERPATFARGELHGHAASARDLADDVVEPVIVEHDVLEPARGRAKLARPKIPACAEPLCPTGRACQMVDIPLLAE